jgi:NAD(P)-dependent dehydrogenase (short-subunit alcohol dehydrogenase family)
VSGLCDGRVVIVTGAGGGLGRAHALAFAAEGASVVVNDIGCDLAGNGASATPAQEVVREIVAGGGKAITNGEDVSSFEGARRLVEVAVETFSGLDVLVNNAGISRDRMLVNMSEEEWDAVIRVHLHGMFGPSRWAAAYWREEAKAERTREGRIINTSSPAGLYGNVGQVNYSTAKAGVAAFTITAARELARYGATVNAIAPRASTRMTEKLDQMRAEAGHEPAADRSPETVSPLVVWLGSTQSAAVTGRVFDIAGHRISIDEGWHTAAAITSPERWEPSALGDAIPRLLESAAPAATIDGAIER